MHPIFEYFKTVSPNDSEAWKNLVSIYFLENEKQTFLLKEAAKFKNWERVFFISHNLLFSANLIQCVELTDKLIQIRKEILLFESDEKILELINCLHQLFNSENKKIAESMELLYSQNAS